MFRIQTSGIAAGCSSSFIVVNHLCWFFFHLSTCGSVFQTVITGVVCSKVAWHQRKLDDKSPHSMITEKAGPRHAHTAHVSESRSHGGCCRPTALTGCIVKRAFCKQIMWMWDRYMWKGAACQVRGWFTGWPSGHESLCLQQKHPGAIFTPPPQDAATGNRRQRSRTGLDLRHW